MQRRVGMTLMITLLVLAFSVPVLGAGVKDGTGPIHSKTPFTYSGTIVSCVPGDGMVLATVDGLNVTIYGIGPDSFWVQYGGKPGVGESIKVVGYTVVYNGELRNIATQITLSDGTVVTLRDSDYKVLWRLR